MRGKSVCDVATSPTERSADLLREAFMLLSTVSPEALREYRSSSSAIISIRHFLSSGHPNDVYLFVSCLSCLDPSIWTGAHLNTVAVLDEREVHGIMRLLDSPDGLIRKTVVHPCGPILRVLTISITRRSRFFTLSIQLSLRRTIHRLYITSRLHSPYPTETNTFHVCLKSSTWKKRMT